MRLNARGGMAEQTWRDVPSHYPHMKLDVLVVMPNRIHLIRHERASNHIRRYVAENPLRGGT
jgi:hypothetical protein